MHLLYLPAFLSACGTYFSKNFCTTRALRIDVWRLYFSFDIRVNSSALYFHHFLTCHLYTNCQLLLSSFKHLHLPDQFCTMVLRLLNICMGLYLYKKSQPFLCFCSCTEIHLNYCLFGVCILNWLHTCALMSWRPTCMYLYINRFLKCIIQEWVYVNDLYQYSVMSIRIYLAGSIE